jgi:hypothetical protein
VTARRNDQPRLEPPLPWVIRNLGRLTVYLAVASLVSAPVFALMEPFASPWSAYYFRQQLGIALALFFYGGLGCLPGLAVWLVILARIPPRWSRLKQRVVATATAPVIGAVWLSVFLAGDGYLLAFVFGLFWPLGSGLVVRLRGYARPNTSPREASDRPAAMPAAKFGRGA